MLSSSTGLCLTVIDASLLSARLRSLVSKIVLTPEDGELAIDVNGDLAGILAIAHEKAPPAGADGASQVKLVAGIGFEPMTFRL